MQLYPEIRFSQDKVNDRLVIDFGAERSFLAKLPLWLLLPAGYCFLMTIMPAEQQGIVGMTHGIFLLVFALVLTAVAQYCFSDRVILDRKSHEFGRKPAVENSQGKRSGFYLRCSGHRAEWKYINADYGSYYEFRLVLVSQTGVIMPVSLGFREDRYKQHVEIARTISCFIGYELVEPNPSFPVLFLNIRARNFKSLTEWQNRMTLRNVAAWKAIPTSFQNAHEFSHLFMLRGSGFNSAATSKLLIPSRLDLIERDLERFFYHCLYDLSLPLFSPCNSIIRGLTVLLAAFIKAVSLLLSTALIWIPAAISYPIFWNGNNTWLLS